MSPQAPTAEVAALRAFVLDRWRERAEELGLPIPDDLSSSCKFGSLLVQILMGGELRGSWDHVHCRLADGTVVDLSEDAADVAAIRARGSDPLRHHRAFVRSRDFRRSIESCRPRVERWAERWRTERMRDDGARGGSADEQGKRMTETRMDRRAVDRFAHLLNEHGSALYGDEWWPGSASAWLPEEDAVELGAFCDGLNVPTTPAECARLVDLYEDYGRAKFGSGSHGPEFDVRSAAATLGARRGARLVAISDRARAIRGIAR